MRDAPNGTPADAGRAAAAAAVSRGAKPVEVAAMAGDACRVAGGSAADIEDAASAAVLAAAGDDDDEAAALATMDIPREHSLEARAKAAADAVRAAGDDSPERTARAAQAAADVVHAAGGTIEQSVEVGTAPSTPHQRVQCPPLCIARTALPSPCTINPS